MNNEDKTQELLDGRAATYGDRVKNMESAADLINNYMDGVEQRSGKREMTGADFAMAMLLYKAYRFAVAPDYSDNINDIFGYAQIARECVGDQMIHATSAEEYQVKKEARKRGYPGVTYDEAKEIVTKNARRAYVPGQNDKYIVSGQGTGRVSVPPVNLSEQADVPSAIIPTGRQQKLRDAELAGKKAAAARKGLQYTESEPGAQE